MVFLFTFLIGIYSILVNSHQTWTTQTHCRMPQTTLTRGSWMARGVWPASKPSPTQDQRRRSKWMREDKIGGQMRTARLDPACCMEWRCALTSCDSFSATPRSYWMTVNLRCIFNSEELRYLQWSSGESSTILNNMSLNMIYFGGRSHSRFRRMWQPWIILGSSPFSGLCWKESLWRPFTQPYTNWSLTGFAQRSGCRILRMCSTHCLCLQRKMPSHPRSRAQIVHLSKTQSQQWAQHQPLRWSLMSWMIARTIESLRSEMPSMPLARLYCLCLLLGSTGDHDVMSGVEDYGLR